MGWWSVFRKLAMHLYPGRELLVTCSFVLMYSPRNNSDVKASTFITMHEYPCILPSLVAKYAYPRWRVNWKCVYLQERSRERNAYYEDEG